MFFIVCVILLFFPDAATVGAREGLKIGLEKVVCAVVPFAIAATAVVKSGGGKIIGSVFSPIFGFLKLNPYGAIPFFSSALGGYPTGANVVGNMYEEKLITKDEAENMLSYANNGGIVFAVNVIGGIFGVKNGIAVWICQLVAALAAGCLLSEKSERVIDVKKEIREYKKTKVNHMAIFGQSIFSGGGIILNILASYVVFYAVCEAIKIDNLPFFAGLTEVVKGVNFAEKTNSIPLAALFFAFGGLNVFVQSCAVCAKYDFSMKKCFFGKVLTGIGAYIFTYGIYWAQRGRWEIVITVILSFTVVVTGLRLLPKTTKSG